MHRGITLVEVLIGLVICLLVVGFAFMFLAHQRENALRTQCKVNLMQFSVAMQTYDHVLKALPPARIAEGYGTWAVLLMPYLPEQYKEHPLQKWDKQQSYFAQPAEVREARLILFFCPQRPRTETLSQAGDVDAH